MSESKMTLLCLLTYVYLDRCINVSDHVLLLRSGEQVLHTFSVKGKKTPQRWSVSQKINDELQYERTGIPMNDPLTSGCPWTSVGP